MNFLNIKTLEKIGGKPGRLAILSPYPATNPYECPPQIYSEQDQHLPGNALFTCPTLFLTLTTYSFPL